MKKLSILASMFIGLALFTACDSDRDDNPTLTVPESFTLLQPTIGETPVDLSISTAVELKISEQPAYGFPTQVTYGCQMTMNNDWSNADSIYTLDGTTNSLTYSASASEIDRGVMTLKGYSSADQMEDGMQTVYLRMTANPLNITDSTANVYSNSVKVNVYPYYMELFDADPDFWWLTGDCIGDAKWSYDKGYENYLSVFPMSLVNEYEYDAKTGAGEFSTTLWLPSESNGGKIKLRHLVNSWDEQWGMNNGEMVMNDGGSGNIVGSSEGYYTLTLNTINNTLTMEAQDITPTVYSSMSIIGLYDDWETDIAMSPASNVPAEHNHLWTVQITVESTTVFKFRANNAWDANWGYGSADGEVNQYGFGTNGGKNIGIEPGKYTIYLNDIDGYFYIAPFTE